MKLTLTFMQIIFVWSYHVPLADSKDIVPTKACNLKPTIHLGQCVHQDVASTFLDVMTQMQQLQGAENPSMELQLQESLKNITDMEVKLTTSGAVAHGTVCLDILKSNQLLMVKCRKGVWMKVSDIVHLSRQEQRQLLVRHKRSWNSFWRGVGRSIKAFVTWPIQCLWKLVSGQNIKCCVLSCGARRVATSRTIAAPIAHNPVITCPTIGDIDAGKGQDKARVNWAIATASDADGDKPSITQTGPSPRPTPNSELGHGQYIVAYTATDPSGRSDSCSVAFSVTVKRCSPFMMSVPRNGATSCTSGYVYGSVCSYSCTPGFELVGVNRAECRSSRTWTAQTPPVCKEKQCPKPSSVSRGSWSSCQVETSAGDTCTLTCDPGYDVIGVANVTCNGDKKWTAIGHCVDSEPPVFSCPPPKSVFSAPNLQPKAVIWSTPAVVDNSGEHILVTSSSNSGDLFHLGVTTVNMSASDSLSNIYSCSFSVEVKAKYCSPLPSPEHANMTCSHASAVGSDCVISCLPGFELSGVATRTCNDGSQPNGTWSGAQPTCDRLACGQQLAVSHGLLNCTGQDYQDVCYLECERGYQLVGHPTSTCEALAAHWSPVGTCTDNQPPVLTNCSDIIQYAERSGQNTTILYTLPQAVDNSGEPVTISGLPAPGGVFGIGTTNVVVTAVDTSGNTATCNFSVNILEIRCNDPRNTGLDQSADQRMEFSCHDGHSYGAKCHVSCSDGNPLSGSDEITCEQNGTSTGHWWSSIQPSCNDSACPTITPPSNGATTCDMLAGKQVCTILCRKGYAYRMLNNQNGYFTCIRSNWTPVSTINSDVCIAGRPPSSATVVPEVYYYADSCSLNLTEIKENFLKLINDTGILSNFCGSANMICDVDSVDVTCGAKRKRRSADQQEYALLDSEKEYEGDQGDQGDQEYARVKRSSGVDVVASFAITVSPGSAGNFSKTMVDFVIKGINDRYQQGVDDGKYEMPNVTTQTNWPYAVGQATYTCPGLKYPQPSSDQLICVACGRGYIYVHGGDSCSICPRGTFQSEDEADACLPCPNNGNTKKEGSTSVDECLDMCHEGQYSVSGYQPCDACSRGTYQNSTMATSCLPCPYGMSTVGWGADSVANCKAYDIPITGGMGGPVLQAVGSNPPDELTVSAFFRVPSDLVPAETTFSLDPLANPGPHDLTMTLGCQTFTVFMSTNTSPAKRHIRQWHHIAVVTQSGQASLYVDGHLLSQTALLSTTDACTSLQLQSNPNVSGVVMSSIQAVPKALTPDEVVVLSQSCEALLEGNLLTINNADGLVNPSSCDAENDCASQPCGNHGVCYDKTDSFTCDCDFPFFGDTCQESVSYCENNKCENGATCISDPGNRNFTCECGEDFRGFFCSEAVVHGGWSSFEEWSACSTTCDLSERSRGRQCDSPAPGPDGRDCDGQSDEVEACEVNPCPVDGGVSAFSPWFCPVTCGNGTANRERGCDSPEPQHGGRNCPETLVESQECTGLSACPVDGGVSIWSSWSYCSASCDTGRRSRVRSCDNPASQFGGQNCLDSLREEEECNTDVCPTCSSLRRQAGSHIARIECETNSTTDTQECHVECSKGYTTKDEGFTCGRLTNYEWSLVTPGNPDGELPQCTLFALPSGKNMTVSALLDVPDPYAAMPAMQANAALALNCTGYCTVTVRLTNMPTARGKRSAGPSTFTIDLATEPVAQDLDLTVATDDEFKQEVDNLNQFEDNMVAMLHSSKDIFSVTQGGQHYAPDPDLMSASLAIACYVGTELLNNLCVDCGIGWYSNDSVCQMCDIGQYQDTPKQGECKTCPEGTTTVWYGAQSISACRRLNSDTNEDTDEFPTWAKALVSVASAAVVGLVVLIVLKLINKQKNNIDPDTAQRTKKENLGSRNDTPMREFPPPYSHYSGPVATDAFMMPSSASILPPLTNAPPQSTMSPRSVSNISVDVNRQSMCEAASVLPPLQNAPA